MTKTIGYENLTRATKIFHTEKLRKKNDEMAITETGKTFVQSANGLKRIPSPAILNQLQFERCFFQFILFGIFYARRTLKNSNSLLC